MTLPGIGGPGPPTKSRRGRGGVVGHRSFSLRFASNGDVLVPSLGGVIAVAALALAGCSRPAETYTFEAIDETRALVVRRPEATRFEVSIVDRRGEAAWTRTLDGRSAIDVRVGAEDIGVRSTSDGVTTLEVARLDGTCDTSSRTVASAPHMPWSSATWGARRIDVMGHPGVVEAFETPRCGRPEPLELPSARDAHVEASYLAMTLIDGDLLLRTADARPERRLPQTSPIIYGPDALLVVEGLDRVSLVDVTRDVSVPLALDAPSIHGCHFAWEVPDALVLAFIGDAATTFVSIDRTSGAITRRASHPGAPVGARAGVGRGRWVAETPRLSIAWVSPGSRVGTELVIVEADLTLRSVSISEPLVFLGELPAIGVWGTDGTLTCVHPDGSVTRHDDLDPPERSDWYTTVRTGWPRTIWRLRAGEVSTL